MEFYRLVEDHQQELDGSVPPAHLHQGDVRTSAGIGHDPDGVLTAQHPAEIDEDNLPLLSSERVG